MEINMSTTINAREMRVITVDLNEAVNVGHEYTFEYNVLAYLSDFDFENIICAHVLGSTLRIITSDDTTSGIVEALARDDSPAHGKISFAPISSFVTSYDDGDTTWEYSYYRDDEGFLYEEERHRGNDEGCFWTEWSDPYPLSDEEFWSYFEIAWEADEVIDVN